ncbi:hypothetical protein K701_30345 [Streptomyces fradiae ATCC 10745 = DSM 40063]|uniref:Uncharacterized protein n=1 Tax=Streptomyces fradiae ATCC 10745 = DSM 40063 TaxID=1319510 RepID=A0ABQ6XK04_STRFR|nr:hypothetical protein K701_30345 [Streptomyces fradiae ATCC 10745 = DSM 40063]
MRPQPLAVASPPLFAADQSHVGTTAHTRLTDTNEASSVHQSWMP